MSDEAVPGAEFGQLLRRRRRVSGLTQEELGERAGVSVRTIADLERGRRARPYRQTVTALAEALGLRGGELDEFVRLARRSLRPVADDSRAGPPELSDVPGVARQLPATVGHFTGRAAELEALTGLLSEPGGPGAVVISALAGTAGVGKTALAVHWSHRVAARFPHGQLYVNLRGYDPREPVVVADALAGFLSALGVPGQQIPDEVEDRARLYRSRLAGRRVLVVLDNARDGDQVRPLLPGQSGCMALVTSRDQLAGLVAADGASRLDLDVLPLADALGLLRSLIGPRAEEDPGAATELARLCARLPLALRIAAEHAAARPHLPLADLVTELEQSRLDLLDTGDARADVRAVFSWSVRHLPGDAAGAFALAGLHPGQDLDAHAAATLAGMSVPRARRVLSRLHRASLLQATGPGRYAMHDLLRAYASELAAGGTDQGLTRLFDYYLAGAAAAMDLLYPAEASLRPQVAAVSAVVPAIESEPDARSWLNSERANLVAMVVYCAVHGWPRHASGLAGTVYRYLITGSHLPEALIVYTHALQAARQSGDRTAEASALNGLGATATMKGHYREAASHYQTSLELWRECGDRQGEARALNNLGHTEQGLHNYRPAADYFGQAIAVYQDAGDRGGEARVLADLAEVETELGSYDQASEHLQLALPVLRQAGDQVYEARTLAHAGWLSLHIGQLTQAAAYFEQALPIFDHLGNPTGVAAQLSNLASVCLGQDDLDQAISYLQQALALNRQAGYQNGEIETLRKLAEALDGAGQHAAARAELQTALLVAGESANTYQLASTHRDLAENYHRASESDQARHHWQQALDLYAQLGAPEVDQIQAGLDDLDSQQPVDRTEPPDPGLET